MTHFTLNRNVCRVNAVDVAMVQEKHRVESCIPADCVVRGGVLYVGSV
jgi:hypothetical protein